MGNRPAALHGFTSQKTAITSVYYILSFDVLLLITLLMLASDFMVSLCVMHVDK
jgi:hypothetical protein